MAVSKATPPTRPPGPSGGKSSLPLIRAGMAPAEIEEIEAWTDDEHARATGLFSILAVNGQLDHKLLPALEPAALRDAYRAMLRARALDAAARALVKAGRIGSYTETAGTEAAVVGAVVALSSEDVVAPGRRAAGAALARGHAVAALVAQLLGNAHDLARGQRLPGSVAVPRALNILPAASHAATQLPHAAGVAWAAKMQKKSTVALALFEAIDVDAEDFHAGINFAGVFRVPAIFVCINDGRAASLATSETIAVRALAYGIAGLRVDGGDLLAMVAAVRGAAERARRGEGATLIEAVVGEPVAALGAPIDRLGRWLAAEKVLDAAAASALAAEVEAEVAAALAAEERIGPPPARAAIENVLARPTAALEEQLEEAERVHEKTVKP